MIISQDEAIYNLSAINIAVVNEKLFINKRATQ